MICHVPPLRLATEEDRDAILSILEDPSVEPYFGRMESSPEDFAWFLFDGGVFAVEIRKDYSAFMHVAVLPGSRGRTTNVAMRALIDFLFQNTPCPRVSGWILDENRRARIWAQMMGGREKMRRGGKVLYRLTRADYAASAVKV